MAEPKTIKVLRAHFERSRSAIERMHKKLTDAPTNPEALSQLRARYRTIDAHYQEMDDSYTHMMEVLEDGTTKTEIVERFEQAEELYYDIDAARAKFSPEADHKPAAREDATQPTALKKARLPRLELPRFTGHIQDWPAFNAVFNSLVDTDTDLTNSDKLFYLLSCIQGEAKQLIGHIRTTDEGYAVARDILQRRYDNPRMLADTLLNAISQLPEISTRTEGLRSQFLNPLLECYKGLENLNFPVHHWSYILLHTVLRKISGELRGLFEATYGSSKRLPTFDDLLEFLEQQCRILVVPQRTTPRRERPVPERRSPRTYAAVAVERLATRACDYCKMSGHHITSCREFERLRGDNKRDKVRTRGLCFRCLGRHLIRDCTAHTRCHHCGRNEHHTLLHLSAEQYRRYHSPERRTYYGRKSPTPRRSTNYDDRPSASSESNRRRNSPRGSPRSSPRHSPRQSPPPQHRQDQHSSLQSDQKYHGSRRECDSYEEEYRPRNSGQHETRPPRRSSPAARDDTC